ncbi:MAG: hypothetical protein JJT75_05425 [Opitutales bacterium]|nr:hypothetical protein [Opitutales bacterium]MCH8541543.1 hypothetical protein [Opitutales bacterium]
MVKLEKEAEKAADMALHSLEEATTQRFCQALATKARTKFPHLTHLLHEFNGLEDKAEQQQKLREIRHFLFELSHLVELLYQRKMLTPQEHEDLSDALIAYSTIVLQIEMLY